MKKVLALLGFCVASPSFAYQPYVELQAGASHFSINGSSLGSTNTTKNGFAGGIRAGVMKSLDNSKVSLGLETGVDYLGKAKVTINTVESKISQNNIDLLGVMSYQMTEQFSPFVKAGVTFAKTSSDPVLSSLSTDRKAAAKVAVGALYQVNENVALTATVNHVFGKELNSSFGTPVRTTSGLIGIRFTA